MSILFQSEDQKYSDTCQKNAEQYNEYIKEMSTQTLEIIKTSTTIISDEGPATTTTSGSIYLPVKWKQ